MIAEERPGWRRSFEHGADAGALDLTRHNGVRIVPGTWGEDPQTCMSAPGVSGPVNIAAGRACRLGAIPMTRKAGSGIPFGRRIT